MAHSCVLPWWPAVYVVPCLLSTCVPSASCVPLLSRLFRVWDSNYTEDRINIITPSVDGKLKFMETYGKGVGSIREKMGPVGSSKRLERRCNLEEERGGGRARDGRVTLGPGNNVHKRRSE